MNPYEELRLPRSATDEEIRQRYKSLAQEHHADRGGDEEKFKRIKHAYEILSDAKLKHEYDTTGNINFNPSVRSEALENLSHLAFNLIPTINPENDDLILMMKNRVNATRDEIQNNINVCNNYITNIAKIILRIKRKKKGENIIRGIAETQLKQRTDELTKFNYQLKVNEEMRQILEDYHYGINDWMEFLEDGAASGNRTRDISLED